MGGVISTFVNAVVNTRSCLVQFVFSGAHGTDDLGLVGRIFGLGVHQFILSSLVYVALIALNLVATVVDVRQVLAILTDAGIGIRVHKRLVQFILNVKGSAESILLSLTGGHGRVVVLIGLFSCLSGVLEKALACVHVVARISSSVRHERGLVAIEEGVHGLLLLMENAPILAGTVFLMRSN